MAKIYGLNGVLSGKLGNSVLVIRSGSQVVRQYQPNVTNPKSTQQKFQRAKANLVGQLSKIVPWQVLLGLGTNKSKRRSRFLRLCLLNTTSGFDAGSSTEISAKLNKEDVIFSEGAILPTMNVAEIAAAVRQVSFGLTKLQGVSDDIWNASGGLFIVVIKSADGMYESVQYRFVSSADVPADGLVVELPHINEGSYYADVYYVPFTTIDGGSLRARSEALFGTAADFEANMVYNPAALPLSYGNSIFIGSASYTD